MPFETQKPHTELSIEDALAKAMKTWKPGGNRSMKLSPAFWKAVFKLRYGTRPSGNDDKRWDPLFKEGLKLVPNESSPQEK